MNFILTCKLGENIINCFDGTNSKEQLKLWSKKRILLCPVCMKTYEYCHGKVKTPYFRHADKEKCNYLYSEQETNEHLNGKKLLYEWIKKQNGVKNVVLEAWLPDTKQRPDIMFEYNGEKCVIEYQCTPISSEYYKRHELYKSAGIKDILICGVEKYIQPLNNKIKRLNTLEEQCGIYFNSKTKQIYKVDKHLNEKEFKTIFNEKKYKLLRSINDYIGCKLVRYIDVKHMDVSYCKEYRYPSPTGRRSNKYPYPVAVYKYSNNVSLARCFDLDKIVLTSID